MTGPAREGEAWGSHCFGQAGLYSWGMKTAGAIISGQRFYWLLPAALALLLGTAGCGSFMARRMVQAPNTYPTWFAPKPTVLVAFHPNF